MDRIAQAELIRSNAIEIERLHGRIHETVKHRDESEAKRLEWQQACAELHARYDELAFPGGLNGAYERIAAGDRVTIDAALTFLEVRPYFFRSGYMWKDLLPKCKRAPMSSQQSERFVALLARYGEWKQQRDMSRKRGQEVLRDLSPLLVRLHGHFPIRSMSDIDFDGILTVGELYTLVCRKLKIVPCTMPSTTIGVAKKDQRHTRPIGSAEYWDSYTEYCAADRAWREFPWTPEEVWATLVAEIIDLYKLDAATEIDSHTVIPGPGEGKQYEP